MARLERQRTATIVSSVNRSTRLVPAGRPQSPLRDPSIPTALRFAYHQAASLHLASCQALHLRYLPLLTEDIIVGLDDPAAAGL